MFNHGCRRNLEPGAHSTNTIRRVANSVVEARRDREGAQNGEVQLRRKNARYLPTKVALVVRVQYPFFRSVQADMLLLHREVG